MNDGVKKVKEYLETTRRELGKLGLPCFSLADAHAEEELRQNMRFETLEDLDFDVMNFYFEGRLLRLCWLASKHAEHRHWDATYDSFKWIVTDLVGWYSYYSKEDEHPALHSSKAYALVLEHLAEACQRGEDKGKREREKSAD